MNAIVTVIGEDKVGIIAKVCTLLSLEGVNILDISQTIMQTSFTMVMMVDMTKCSSSFQEVQQKLKDLGTEMGLSIRIQREEIFNAMHSI